MHSVRYRTNVLLNVHDRCGGVLGLVQGPLPRRVLRFAVRIHVVDGLLVEHLRDAIDHHLTPVLVLGLVDVIIQVAEAVEHAIASEQQDLVAHGGAGTMGRGVSEVAAPPPYGILSVLAKKDAQSATDVYGFEPKLFQE